MSEVTIEKINSYQEELVKILRKSKADKKLIENFDYMVIINAIQTNKEPKDLAWELMHL